MIELEVEACSVVYSSPLVLVTLSTQSNINGKKEEHKEDNFENLQLYNPFIEDVFSLGLTIL